MQERFKVDGLTYEIRIGCTHEISFAIVGGANCVYAPPLDPYDWDSDPAVMSDIGVTRYPLRVYRAVLSRVENWIGCNRPKYFSFETYSPRRLDLYERITQRLAKHFHYDLQSIDGTYLFFKLQ